MKGILGADIFSTLLLVFLISTAMLLRNTNREVAGTVHAAPELSLPGVRLPVADSNAGTAPTSKRQVTLTAKREKGKVSYFVDNVLVSYKDILPRIRMGGVQSVKIRFDKDIPYGQYVQILDLCRQAGIHEVINVYTTDKP